MAVTVHSGQAVGLSARLVDVEVDLVSGLHAFAIVGLPDKAVEEAKDRLSAAIKNSRFLSPQKKNQRVTVSLAPADLRKEGPAFDLPIALAYLLASKQVLFDPAGKIFLGELALDGSLRPVKGVLVVVRGAKEKGFKEIFVPRANTREAALVRGITVYGVENLGELADHFGWGGEGRRPAVPLTAQEETEIVVTEAESPTFDFADIRGQETAKRGLMLAAAGGHNVLLFGPPGTGKTMLARALSGILPPLTFNEALEVTAIQSVAGILEGEFASLRPIRAPHHTASHVSVVGGGANPRPGEITLAHRGVLFLDEFPEFERRVIESLRQPLEDGVVTVARAKETVTFPARFILVCAMNPCPCGYLGAGGGRTCLCSPAAIARYARRASGPITDRIDLHLEVPTVLYDKLVGAADGETSATIRRLVLAARARQSRRFRLARRTIGVNAEMTTRDLQTFVVLDAEGARVMRQAAERLGLSGRGYHRILKVARTVADLEESEAVLPTHLLEAVQYREGRANLL